jgi:protein-disulfide isomerase
VRYVVLDFPLPRHPEAERDAVAARCAGEQGMYWLAHRALLADPQLARNGPLDLGAFAARLGLDDAALAECVDSGRQVAAVRDGARRAASARVDGTPTFLVGFPRQDDARAIEIARHLEGAVGLEPVVEAIEALRESLRQRGLRERVDH